jgi:type I restriction enzyme M protein
MIENHRGWIKERYKKGWKKDYTDEHVKIFKANDFAYHKVSVVFWQFDENDKPAIITEPYTKAFTAANINKEQKFYESELKFAIKMKADGVEKKKTLTIKEGDKAVKLYKSFISREIEIISVDFTHRHYVQDDEYIPYGEDIAEFLKREIAKPIIRWEDRPQLGYEFLPNKYFYKYAPPRPAKDLLDEFWTLEQEAGKMLKGLSV